MLKNGASAQPEPDFASRSPANGLPATRPNTPRPTASLAGIPARSATRHGYPRRHVHETSAGPHSVGYRRVRQPGMATIVGVSTGRVQGLTRSEYRPRSATRHGYPAAAHALPAPTSDGGGRPPGAPALDFRLASPRPTPQHGSGKGALPPRPPQGGVAPLTRTSCPPWGLGRKGSARAEYRLVRQRFRSLAKTPRLPVCPLPGEVRVQPPRLTTPASENRAQETARPHPCRSTRSAWQRRPSPVRPG